MTMRPFTDMRAGLNHIVDAQIGRAFPVVHKVYQHLDTIEYIAQVYESGRSRDIVLRTNHTKEWIEWQYKGEDTWTILFKFSDLLGADIADVVAAEQAIAAELVALRVYIDQTRSDTLDASDRAQAAELGAVDAKNAAEVAQASAHASAQSAAAYQTATEVAAATGAQHLADIEAQVVAAEALKQETIAAHQAGLAAKASAEEAAVNAATFAENADVSAAESATSANEAEASANAAELSAQNAAAHKVEAKNQAVAAEASALASATSATVSSEKLGELIPLHAAAVTASTTATEAAETVTTHLVQVTALHSATESFAQTAQASAVQADSAATAAGESASDALQLRNETQGFHDAASTMVVDAVQVSADRATVQTLAQEVQLAANQAQSNALAAADSANAANDSASIAQTSASEILGQVTTLSSRLDEADSIVTAVTVLRDETLSYKLAIEDSTTNAQAVAADRAAVADMMGTIAADAASAADSKNQALAAAATAAQAEAAANTAVTVAQNAAQEVASNTTAAQDAATAALSSQASASDLATQAAASLTAVVPLHTEVVTKHAEVLVRADQVAEDLLAADAAKGAAEIAQADTEAAKVLARAWATKTDGPVLNDGGDKFSAQYWATQAEQSAIVAADANTGVLGALANHTAAADPHTQYLTKAESIDTLAAKLDVNDPSVTNAREWTASEVSQAEAEAGTATTARKWTAQRVRQAITGWWSGIGTTFGKSLLSLTDSAAGRTALGLSNVDNTTDADKPISTATASALSGKFDKTGGDISGNVNLLSLNGGQLAGFRNKIINGNFDIWQRGNAFSVGNGAYSADRFIAVTYGTSSGTVTRRAVVPGSAAQLNTGANNKLEIKGASGLSFCSLEQRIEDVTTFSGKKVTISIYSDTSAPNVVPYFRIVQNFGTDGSAMVFVDTPITQTVGENGDYVWSATVSIPSVSGKTVGAASFLLVALVYVPNLVDAVYGFYGMQVESGSKRTPFEQRPYGLELALCQRYYYRVTSNGIDIPFCLGYNSSTTKVRFLYYLPVKLRSVPTIFEQNGSATDYQIQHDSTYKSCSAVPVLVQSNSRIIQIEATVDSGLTPGQGSVLRAAIPGVYLGFSAEL